MRFAACAALLAAGIAVLAAQPQQPIRVGTSFVRVDAYPMKDGRIVDGLQAADFEVLEDGVPQRIDTFEHVVSSFGPQTARTEPGSQREIVRALANPRSRVFLIFLDGPHVDAESSTRINEPLIKFLTSHVADDDLVGLMTPGMSASQVTFGRKTAVFESGLRPLWAWGRQNRGLDPELDRRQIQYSMCFTGTDAGEKMVRRSRERATLEAFQDAVGYLASIREERKAIVAVTEGWVLYREDPEMMRQGKYETPIGVDKITVGPTGQPTIGNPRGSVNTLPPNECDADRVRLSQLDNERFLREIIDDANRGNATFYMIDPSGLSMKRADRSTAMRTLAENTDGFAMLNTNDLDSGLARVSGDMASYYLLGYYASNSKPDGRYRTITVRVKQPGVEVRARKGYRAPTVKEVADGRAVETASEAPATAAVSAAIDRLGALRPDARLRLNAAVVPGPQGIVWVAGELQSTGSRPDAIMQGAKAVVEVIAGDRSSTASLALKPGELAFLSRLELPVAPGNALDVRVRLTPDGGAAEPLLAGIRLDPPATGLQPLMFRRGVTTGNRVQPAGDPRFRRTERARFEVPVGPAAQDAKPGAGRVLDRRGAATQVPVVVGERIDDTTAQRWITADVALGALSPGDYVIEMLIAGPSGEQRVLKAIRIVN